jgi:glycosyltransferase involved in cell wall biosynthesis
MAEALACGTPVIAPADAGALEIVESGRTGILLDSVDPPSIVAALAALARLRLDPAACRRSALRFSRERFSSRLEAVLAEELELSASTRPAQRAQAAAAAR